MLKVHGVTLPAWRRTQRWLWVSFSGQVSFNDSFCIWPMMTPIAIAAVKRRNSHAGQWEAEVVELLSDEAFR